MPSSRTLLLTIVAMLAFAGNSLLCRLALKSQSIDAASFTLLRLASGALLLWCMVAFRAKGTLAAHNAKNAALEGRWSSALALFAYAAGFSFAYMLLPAATGALLLFGAVQVTMMGTALYHGGRFTTWQTIGFILACAGLVGLLLPGLAAPPLLAACAMLCAGIAWGIYSLQGKSARNPIAATAGNFLRAVPFAVGLSLLTLHDAHMQSTGVWLAIASGAIASGIGYAIWYTALPGLKASQAATVQLCVPLLAALGGIVFLDELFSLRLLITSVVILGGVALVIFTPASQTTH